MLFKARVLNISVNYNAFKESAFLKIEKYISIEIVFLFQDKRRKDPLPLQEQLKLHFFTVVGFDVLKVARPFHV